MKQTKRSGGPKTDQGKVRSSKNAVSHGLTSLAPSNSNEKALIESYTQELNEYHQPKSPLERLQIQRIATCRAKLSYLYDLEQIKLALAAKELESQPEKILEKIPGVSGLAKALARDLIKDGQVYLPCRLDPSLLEAICNEIKELHGTLENKYQFARELPKLTKYLNAYPVVGLNNSDQWMEKLSSVSKDLDKVFSRGEEFAGKWDKFYKTYLLGMEYEEQLANEAMKPQLEELQRYQEEARIRCGQKPIKREPAPAPDPNVIADLQAVQEKLAKFGSLYKSYQQAQNLVFPYNEIKDLMMRAICLPQAESDLLMRYQTTLERRLSMSIGELLELQRAKNPH